jgi:phosphoglycolate phosphatase-like HAD superfamily hydrolase
MPKEGLLENLAKRASLAIFTGRVKYEADATLGRYAPHVSFDPLVTDECVANPKPAPDGLRIIQQQYPGKHIWYLGDTVDDARSARAAGVPFIGVSTPFNPRHAEITRSLEELGAFVVLTDINDLEALL